MNINFDTVGWSKIMNTVKSTDTPPKDVINAVFNELPEEQIKRLVESTKEQDSHEQKSK